MSSDTAVNYKPIPFYFLNTHNPCDYTRECCDAAMHDLASNGFGGCILFNKPPTGFSEKEFLGDFWFEVIENFLLAGQKYGLEMWINDGFDYPPGDAAGRIKDIDPSLKQMRLRLNAGGEAEIVDVPWGFPAFELPESSELFIKLVYEPYYKRIGKYFGNALYGFFSDCDNRRINSANVAQLENGLYFPWSRNFASSFERRFGYSIMPHLSAVLKGDAPQATHDYWELAGELYQQWFAGNHAWCQAHNLAYSFHTSDSGPLSRLFSRRSSAFSEGAPLTLLQHSDFPGTDHEIAVLDSGIHYDARYFMPEKCWGNVERVEYPHFSDTRHDIRAKLAGSAAYMNNAPRCLCEMFAATNYCTDFQELRRIAMWQIMQGINFIVPHAVHHRFFGVIKYFAPPEFLHGSLRNGIKEFNEYLANACRIASVGHYQAAVALLDSTPALWDGNTQASENFFALCDRLNRSACGYVIVTPEYLEKHEKEFACVINPTQWNGMLNLGELPGGDVYFSGGKLAYMRRKLPDGTEFLIAANIWSNQALNGRLSFNQHFYDIQLVPGEYAVLGGPDENYRSVSRRTVLSLPMLANVQYDSPYRIPLESWSNVNGDRHEFCWICKEMLQSLELEIPCSFAGNVECDGVSLTQYASIEVFDDKYKRYKLPAEVSFPGMHSIALTGNVPTNEIAYLVGNFETKLWIDGPNHSKIIRAEYNISIYEPKRFILELAHRRTRLCTGTPLAEQGLVFYDGNTKWHWDFYLPKSIQEIALTDTCGVCDLFLDEAYVGRLIQQPYSLPVKIDAGRHSLEVVLYGSLGALLEGGNAKVQLGVIEFA